MQTQYSKILLSILLSALIAACASKPQGIDQEVVKETSATVTPSYLPEVQAQFASALTLLQQNKLADAKKQLTVLVREHPEMAGAHVNLGIIALMNNDARQAETHFTTALVHNPKNADALLQLAALTQGRGEFKETEQLLLRAESVDETSDIVQFNLGVLYELYLQDYEQAISHYQQYIDHSTNQDKAIVERWIKLLERKL